MNLYLAIGFMIAVGFVLGRVDDDSRFPWVGVFVFALFLVVIWPFCVGMVFYEMLDRGK